MMEARPIPPLACTVRGCGRGLAPRDRLLACDAGHTFDLARSGYVNLLQPQDRKSSEAGDSRVSVEARARLLASGVGRGVLAAFVKRAASLLPQAGGVVADLGSGSGEALALLGAGADIQGIGIDLSVHAAEHAARRHAGITWVVANADRRLPLLDGSVDLVLSLHARRNAVECARVLKSPGALLVAVPAPEDLVELRELVQGARVERDRADGVIAEHAGLFTLDDRSSARERHALGREALLDLLHGTYRGARSSVTSNVDSLQALDVTLASDLLVFRPVPAQTAR